MSMIYHNVEAEQSIIGVVLNDRTGRAYVMSRLTEQHFSNEEYRAVFKAAWELEEDGVHDIDPSGLADVLKRNGSFDMVGGIRGVMDMCTGFFSAQNAERNVDEILKGVAQHSLVVSMRKALSSLELHPVKNLDELDTHLAVMEEDLRGLSVEKSDVIDYHDCLDGEKLERGLLSGYAELDEHIDVRPGMIVTVYGDSGHKKTTFAMNLVARWAKKSKIAVYNYEQRPSEIARMVNEADLYNDIPKGNLWISPRPPHIENLPMQVKAIKSRVGLDGVVVDYLQTMTTSNNKLAEDETNMVRYAMRVLRDLAIRENMFVIVVAQMRKHQGDTMDHQMNPPLDRMRGSGEIKMASSIVLSTVLPIKLGQDIVNDDHTAQMLLVRIKKNRDCLTGNPGEERAVKLVHQLDGRLITSWHHSAGLPPSRLPTSKRKSIDKSDQ